MAWIIFARDRRADPRDPRVGDPRRLARARRAGAPRSPARPRGAPTDTTLEPGVHWVPALRRRMVVEYPALELAYRAGDRVADERRRTIELERSGPALSAPLGDRTVVTVGYTVRFRLDVTMIQVIHTRFGDRGDLGRGPRRERADAARRARRRPVRYRRPRSGRPAGRWRPSSRRRWPPASRPSGLVVTMFNLGDLDLGRAGDVIQATVRARLELQREEAEAAMRMARARIDAELGPYIDPATSGCRAALSGGRLVARRRADARRRRRPAAVADRPSSEPAHRSRRAAPARTGRR